MGGGTLLQPHSLPVTWQATLKPYKHQISHLGRVEIEHREERGNPDGRAQTYPTYPVMSAASKKSTHSSYSFAPVSFSQC